VDEDVDNRRSRRRPRPGDILALNDPVLMSKVLSAQPASVRNMLLQTSILHRVSADLASELTGDEQPADALPALARADALVQPVGHGW
jgi:ATP/maltotriose-dependent transcriptional regulator MalT